MYQTQSKTFNLISFFKRKFMQILFATFIYLSIFSIKSYAKWSNYFDRYCQANDSYLYVDVNGWDNGGMRVTVHQTTHRQVLTTSAYDGGVRLVILTTSENYGTCKYSTAGVYNQGGYFSSGYWHFSSNQSVSFTVPRSELDTQRTQKYGMKPDYYTNPIYIVGDKWVTPRYGGNTTTDDIGNNSVDISSYARHDHSQTNHYDNAGSNSTQHRVHYYQTCYCGMSQGSNYYQENHYDNNGDGNCDFCGTPMKKQVNINVLNPNGVEDGQSGYFDMYFSNTGDKYYNLTNENNQTTRVIGSAIYLTNIRPYYGYYAINYVEFNGSNVGSGTGPYKYTVSSSASQTINIHMKYKTYTVTFNANGGSGTTNSAYPTYNSTNYNVWGSNQLSVTRPGYTLVGQYDAIGDGNEVYDANGNAVNGTGYQTGNVWKRDSSVTLYARQKPGVYTVTLNNQSPSVPGTTSVPATFGSAMPTITLPLKTGYTFGGYFTEMNGNGTQYYSESGESLRNYDITSASTMYAKQTANNYMISFEGNGNDSGSMLGEPMVYDVEKVLLQNTYKKIGYTFVCWNTKADGTGDSYADMQSVKNLTPVPDGSAVLYAQWSDADLNVKDKEVIEYEDKNPTEEEYTAVHGQIKYPYGTIKYNYSVEFTTSTEPSFNYDQQYKPAGSDSWTSINAQTTFPSGSVFTADNGTLTITKANRQQNGFTIRCIATNKNNSSIVLNSNEGKYTVYWLPQKI